jgi:hypothetical protein
LYVTGFYPLIKLLLRRTLQLHIFINLSCKEKQFNNSSLDGVFSNSPLGAEEISIKKLSLGAS